MGSRRALRLLIALLASLVAGCAALPGADFDTPDIELLGLRPLSGRGMEARFLVALRITNPNATSIDIDGMAYEIALRGTRVLTGVSNQPLSVGAYSEATAELEVAAGLLGSLALLRDLMASPPRDAIPYALRAKLSLRGLGGTLRINREGEISLEDSSARRSPVAA